MKSELIGEYSSIEFIEDNFIIRYERLGDYEEISKVPILEDKNENNR